MVVLGIKIVSLTCYDIEIDILQTVYQGGSVGHISQHSKAITACGHIQNTKYSTPIGKVDVSLS